MEFPIKGACGFLKKPRSIRRHQSNALCAALLFITAIAFLSTARAQPAPPPVITTLLPNTGLTNGGTIVTLSGTGFQPGATVNFGAQPAASVTVNSATNLTAVTPPSFFATVDVTVSNPDTQSAVLPQAFTYSIQPIYNWTTIAGVPANGAVDGTNNSARFTVPVAAAQDAAGNIYVVNNGNNTIRKLTTPDGTNWISSTIAGTPGVFGSTDGTNNAILFNNPNGIAVDAQTNLYVVDSGNRTIRELTPVGTNWVSSTIAGTAGVGGLLDGTNNTIKFIIPFGIALDATNNLYVTDGSAVRKLTLIGTNRVSAIIAGGAASGNEDGIYQANNTVLYTRPEGIAVDANGNIYVADNSNENIRMINQQGTNWVSSTVAGSTNLFARQSGSADGTNYGIQFFAPTGITLDANTNLYVTDTLNSTIRLLTPQGTNWVSSTIAGTVGTNGSTDGTNNDTLYFWPQGIVLAGNGNLLITDTRNDTLRTLAPSGTNWVSSTIAGQPGSAGDANGTNDAILFDTPAGIAVDSATNIYVANTAFNTIRKLSLSGTNWVSTTIAGQSLVTGSTDATNTVALFNHPSGLSVDGTGDVYIADTANQFIRKLTLTGTDYVSSRFFGSPLSTTPPAGLLNPKGVTVAGGNTVYLVDTGNNQIIGTPGAYLLAGSSSPFPPAGTNDGETLGIRLNNPTCMAVDAGSHGYVTDTYNHTIRFLSITGVVAFSSTIAGAPGISGSLDATNNASRFFQPEGITVDAQTNVYIADTGNSTIRKMARVGTNWVTSTIGGFAGDYGSADGINNNSRFANPAAIAVDASSNLYVADTYNNTIRIGTFTPAVKLTPVLTWSNPAPITFAPLSATQLNASANVPGALVYSPPLGSLPNPGIDTLSVVFTPSDTFDFNSVTDSVSLVVSPIVPVITFIPSNGAGIIGNTTTINASIFGPGPFAYQWQFNGSIFTNLPIITTVAGNGLTTFSGNGGPATNAAIYNPIGVAVDGLGDLFITDTLNNRIRKVDANGIITTVAGNGTNTFSGNGIAATNAAVFNPNGITLDGHGNLFIADTLNNRIRKVDANGIITTVAGGSVTSFTGDGTAATNAGLSGPKSVSVDAFGNIFIADSAHQRIRKVDTNGIITTVAGNGSTTFAGDGTAATNAGLNSPAGVAVDNLGNLFIADTSDSRIRKVDTNGIITTVAGKSPSGFSGDGGAATNAGLSSPNGLAVDAFGNLFIADTSDQRIRKVDANGIITTLAGKGTSGFSGDGGIATNAAISRPGSVAVDPFGNVFIADSGNNRIRKLSAPSLLTLTNLTLAKAGNYQLIVTSPYGVTTNSFTLDVGLPPLQANLQTTGGLQLSLTGTPGSNYVLQAASSLTPPILWTPVFTNTADVNGNWTYTDTTTASSTNRYYRLTVP